jgi:hypothetical protein
LANDIDLSNYNGFTGWEPIGYFKSGNYIINNEFKGCFDGNNHIISNLTIINRRNEDYIGLFGRLYNAVIANLGVENIYIGGGSNYIGGIVRDMTNSRIINSHSTGNITGYSYSFGGITGSMENSNITNSYFSGNIIGGDLYIGGIVGSMSSGNIINSYSTANVNGIFYVDGIAGGIDACSIFDSYSTGTIIGNGYRVGGIVGAISDSNISNTLAANAKVDVGIGSYYYINRIIGSISGNSNLYNNYANKDMIIDLSDGYGGNSVDLSQIDENFFRDNLHWKIGNDSENSWKMVGNKKYPILYWQK